MFWGTQSFEGQFIPLKVQNKHYFFSVNVEATHFLHIQEDI